MIMRRRRAFTLVELLVVIGTIAVLIGILLPVLGRARETANRTACAANMRAAGQAILLYINANKGALPFPGGVTATPSDAIWWQNVRIADIGKEGVGPYMKLSPTDLRLFRCPTDSEGDKRQVDGKYPLTYSFNSNLGGIDKSLGGDALQPVRKLTQVRTPAARIYVIEENGPSLNDASAVIWARTGEWNTVGMLGLRHDRINRTKYPDTSTAAVGIVNGRGKANALFADFRVDYVERHFAHAKSRALPYPDATEFAGQPEYGP